MHKLIAPILFQIIVLLAASIYLAGATGVINLGYGNVQGSSLGNSLGAGLGNLGHVAIGHVAEQVSFNNTRNNLHKTTVDPIPTTNILCHFIPIRPS